MPEPYEFRQFAALSSATARLPNAKTIHHLYYNTLLTFYLSILLQLVMMQYNLVDGTVKVHLLSKYVLLDLIKNSTYKHCQKC